jgi:hypothetical protein
MAAGRILSLSHLSEFISQCRYDMKQLHRIAKTMSVTENQIMATNISAVHVIMAKWANMVDVVTLESQSNVRIDLYSSDRTVGLIINHIEMLKGTLDAMVLTLFINCMQLLKFRPVKILTRYNFTTVALSAEIKTIADSDANAAAVSILNDFVRLMPPSFNKKVGRISDVLVSESYNLFDVQHTRLHVPSGRISGTSEWLHVLGEDENGAAATTVIGTARRNGIYTFAVIGARGASFPVNGDDSAMVYSLMQPDGTVAVLGDGLSISNSAMGRVLETIVVPMITGATFQLTIPPFGVEADGTRGQVYVRLIATEFEYKPMSYLTYFRDGLGPATLANRDILQQGLRCLQDLSTRLETDALLLQSIPLIIATASGVPNDIAVGPAAYDIDWWADGNMHDMFGSEAGYQFYTVNLFAMAGVAYCYSSSEEHFGTLAKDVLA